MGLIRRRKEERAASLTVSDYLAQLNWLGTLYPMPQQTLQGTEERVSGNFEGLVSGAYQSDGVVFACILARMLLFSEARFIFRQLRNSRPGNLFGTTELGILETPWPNGTTGDLLARALVDADLAGNAFIVRAGNRLRRLRPDWMTIVLGSDASEWDADVAGYLYHPGGKTSGHDPVVFDVSQVAHFAPIPDPTSPHRGMSWLNPVISEIEADKQATQHKRMFFVNGATPNMVITGLPQSKEQFDAWVEKFRQKHEGSDNAYRNLYLSGAVDAKVVGANLQQLDFKVTQGAGETRIAAAAGVPPVIVGLSEGLQAATYSNYAQARRRFADGTIRPLWRNFCGSVAKLVTVPQGSQLWYDDRDIPFLHEDALDATTIRQTQAASISTLVSAGFDADSVVDAVVSGDMTRLTHTGLFSVQLHPPNTGDPAVSGGAHQQQDGAPPRGEELSLEEFTLALQKIYLSVGVVISPEEARQILNRYGAALPAKAPEGLGPRGSYSN